MHASESFRSVPQARGAARACAPRGPVGSPPGRHGGQPV